MTSAPSARTPTASASRQSFRRDPVASLARWLHSRRPASMEIDETPSSGSTPIAIVCISDTHNTQPPVPDGDVLLHAGDLTNDGTFDELQSQLTWLASLPHQHKIVIAGNHDRLLDATFVAEHPERIKEGLGSARADLNMHDITYLQDSSLTLPFPPSTTSDDHTSISCPSVHSSASDHRAAGRRTIKIYGSPRTPDCGTFAFQYPPIRDVWKGKIPDDADIVLVHGPPKGYLDGLADARQQKGCPHLLRELRRVRPRFAVFGHIHRGPEVENVTWMWGEETISSRLASVNEDLTRLQENGLARWFVVIGMIIAFVAVWVEALVGRATAGLSKRRTRARRSTTMVNAALGADWEAKGRKPFVFQI